jgi:hypothetical protein
MKTTTPELQHDKMMFEQFGTRVSPRGKIERRIVAGLCEHLLYSGFSLHSVYDGEEETRVSTAQEAMELIFNLDEAALRFYRDNPENWHGILLVLGNGEDIISDWNFYVDDRDGFDAAMSKFNVEEFV